MAWADMLLTLGLNDEKLPRQDATETPLSPRRSRSDRSLRFNDFTVILFIAAVALH